MSYSAIPVVDDDTLESPTFNPPKLQLRNFDFTGPSFSLDTGAEGSGSKTGRVKSGVHSGTSYEMVDSDRESEYDAGEAERGGSGQKDQRREGGVASSGVLVSKFLARDNNNASLMQGGASHHGNQQHRAQQQYREHSHSGSGGMDRPGAQLDGRADTNEREQRGGVSADTSPQHEYQADTDHSRSPRRGRGDSRPQPLLSPPQPEFVDRRGSTYQISPPPNDTRPVFRYSQSVPELPPVDVESLHIPDDRDFRPATSASGVGDLFKDFDGVHFDTEHPEAPGFPLRNQHFPPPPAHYQNRQSQAYPRPQSHHSGSQASLVFYPAPVPAMLNLPPTLSKARPNNRNSRHLAAESIDLPVNNRRSLAYPSLISPDFPPEKDRRRSVAGVGSDHPSPNRRSIANLPPALRASQFFDSQLPQVVPDLKEESAVATLDSILNASAKAPAAAFTDHPSAGGPAPYANANAHARSRSTATQLGNYRNSVAFNVKLHPGESPRSSIDNEEHQDHHHYHQHQEDGEEADSHLNQETGEYYDPARFSGVSDDFGAPSTDHSQQALPTTLLAELESRKAQQRLRSRTAASAFPRGIRSTLLQLDAVAQVQQQHRRNKKTHLAWEEPDDGPDEEERDDDVPLGLLFAVPAGTQKRRDEEVPLGLLMKKEMEDAEPLSKRRERLRQQNGGPPRRMLDVPGLGAAEGEEELEVEGETLRDRMKRLREKQQFGTGTLDIDLMTDKERDERLQHEAAAKPEIEETLAQRRRRLQREREEGVNTATLKRESMALQQEVKNRRNMADILHVRPMGMAARPTSFYSGGANGSHAQLHQGYGQPHQGYGQPQQGYGQGGMNMGMGGYGMAGPGLIGRGAGPMGAMGMGGGMMGMGEAPLDPKQMEMVERWRASVM